MNQTRVRVDVDITCDRCGSQATFEGNVSMDTSTEVAYAGKRAAERNAERAGWTLEGMGQRSDLCPSCSRQHREWMANP